MGSKMNYKDFDSINKDKKFLNEVAQGISDASRTIATSAYSEELGALIGCGAGVGVGVGMIGMAGTGAGAVAITSGLATLGGVVGGGMMAGVFVAAAPVAILGIGTYAIFAHQKKQKLSQAKQEMLREAIKKHDAVIKQLNNKSKLAEDRINYLIAVNLRLQEIIRDLKADLQADGVAA